MKPLTTIALLTVFAAAPGLARAQPAAPNLGFVYPAGGQQGTTFTVSVGGQNLNDTSAAILSGSGAQIRVVGFERPLTQRELNDLREELQRLQEKRAAARNDAKQPFTAADEKRTAEIRQLMASRGNRQVPAAIAQTVMLEITLDPNASIGERELRLRTAGGLSNPLAFWIGQQPEATAPVVIATASRPARVSPKSAREVTLPATINGQILPGEVDRHRFAARQGQRLTFAVSARALVPYLADAVPGWFQATLAVRDPGGRELAYVDDYRFGPDPVLACEIPADGQYTVEIKDALFRGREDFVYRIVAGELPFITHVYPLGGVAGRRIGLELNGWNLPRERLEIDTEGRTPGTLLLSLPNQGQFSNAVRFRLDAARDGPAAELDDTTAETAQHTLPIVVNGRIERPGDDDVFRFTGRAGEQIVAEVMARRLGSPLDSILLLSDANGRVLANNDDSEDKGAGLLTHHADSAITYTLPADGAYSLRVADAQRQGGPDYGYRLRVGAPQPDFELRVVPSAINVRAGASVPITVYALRRDGFSGEIALALGDRSGFVLSGARIPAGQSQVKLTITAANVRDELTSLRLFGRATIAGAAVTRPAVPADDREQAFAYHHLVPAREFRACVVGRGSTMKVLDAQIVRLVPGEPGRVRVAAPVTKNVRSVTFELHEPPSGIAVKDVSHRNGVAEIVLTCDPAAIKTAGGNLILQAWGERPNVNPQKATGRGQRVPLGFLPAIPFDVAGMRTAGL